MVGVVVPVSGGALGITTRISSQVAWLISRPAGVPSRGFVGWAFLLLSESSFLGFAGGDSSFFLVSESSFLLVLTTTVEVALALSLPFADASTSGINTIASIASMMQPIEKRAKAVLRLLF